jgi:beta-mannosidase
MEEELPVFEAWRLMDFAPGEGEEQAVFSEAYEARGWMEVSVPGDVHTALMAAGRIPDPFYDRNELACAWIEAREWWYRAQSPGEIPPVQPDERLLLIFHGLDTFATIWLNGVMLGKHENMFREAAFDVGHIVRPNEANTLAVCFEPPLRHVADRPPLTWGSDLLDDTKRNLMRKAQFGFGWDWGPRLPTVGIWRPVELRRQRQAAISAVHFRTDEIDPTGEEALVSVAVEIDCFAGDAPLDVAVSLDWNEADVATAQVRALAKHGTPSHVEIPLRVKKPRLWWPRDLGEPALYRLQVAVLRKETELDRKRLQVGIRSVVLDRSPDPDEAGTCFFRFVVNGIPIFARGANWIPRSSFVGGLRGDDYRRLLSAARDANMNMLRVWGGGIYEHDAFYDLCDRLGILVWQDFMFACAPYPQDDPIFVAEVREEACYQVARLRNHPSLALWCGNNENQWIHLLRTHPPTPGVPTPLPGVKYYDEIIPEAVAALDGRTPYWPGSPYGGPHPNSTLEGDVHDWHVWHGLPVDAGLGPAVPDPQTYRPTPEDVAFTHYAENMGRFISEFGMHASPVMETLRRCIPAEDLYHHSPAMDHHNKDNPKKKGDYLMLTVTGLPKDLEEYVDFSMLAQAEGLKFGIEHFRRRKPHCAGTLLWQFNDCWPGLSWSILDFYGFGKAGYYYVKRAYAPVLASFKARHDGAIELWVTNDTLHEVDDVAVIQIGSFMEGTIWHERRRIRVPANSSRSVGLVKAHGVIPGSDNYLAVRSETDQFPANRHFLAAIKDLKRRPQPPEISIVSRGDHELAIHIRASSYLLMVHVLVNDEHTRYSDNYFDMSAGESRTIAVTNPGIRLTPAMVSAAWC